MEEKSLLEVLNYAPCFTHPDAEVLFTELADRIDDYASQCKPFADTAWAEFQRNKINKGRDAAGYNA
jgi:hypothetical protein